MEVIFVLVPVSLAIILVALWAFVWSVRNDQFEDLEKEAYRILFDDAEQDTNQFDKSMFDKNMFDKNKVNNNNIVERQEK